MEFYYRFACIVQNPCTVVIFYSVFLSLTVGHATDSVTLKLNNEMNTKCAIARGDRYDDSSPIPSTFEVHRRRIYFLFLMLKL